MPASCTECQAPVFWGRTKAGKNIPLDVEPHQTGTVIVIDPKPDDRDAVGVLVLSRGDVVAVGVKRYKVHFATCPNPSKFRKPKETKAK